MSSEREIQQALDAANSGDMTAARKILSQVVQQYPSNARAWYLLSQAVEKPEQAIQCLEWVLKISPENRQANELLKQLALLENTSSNKLNVNGAVSPQQSGNSSQTIPEERGVEDKWEKTKSIVYTMKGVQDVLEVFDDKVTITPKGFLALVNKGVKGTKTIPYTSITAIQFKKPGLTNGYLQFSLPGGIEGGRGIFEAIRDENTFMFAGQTELALEIKDFIEKRIEELRKPQTAQAGISISDELNKLAKLKEMGILSEDEFQLAKRRLLE